MTIHRRLYFRCDCGGIHFEEDEQFNTHRTLWTKLKVSEFVEEVFSTVLMEHELGCLE